jgi:KAP family P-loop domain
MTVEAPTPETEDPRAAIWQDDVLDRRGFADFLTKALTEQTRVVSESERQPRGLTVALDAGWGTGKTFFVKHWADDLKQRGHPVVFFDAWENDLGEEAAIALMAAIKDTIDEWVARMPAKQELAALAGEMVRDGVKELRRAVLPVSKVVAAGMLRKFTGIGVKEFMDAVDGDDALSAEPQESLSNEKIEAGLDKIFESALGEQKKRSEAIKNFKASMSKALELIDQNTEANLPAFVFVDELDRCRPSYAINLLEEIKHIFGMPNVCFVVSTNIDQLSHSTRGVYGGEFDANGYLKRFFDQEFTLPEPDREKYVDILIKETNVLKNRDFSLGLPERMEPLNRRNVATAISFVFDAFDLDLRSQKQIFTMADTVASSIEEKKKIYVVWLFFLVALLHKKPQAFNLLSTKEKNNQVIKDILEKEINQNVRVEYSEYDNRGDRDLLKSSGLNSVIEYYYDWSNRDAAALNDIETKKYPQSNASEIQDELPRFTRGASNGRPSISGYVKLVKYAGYLREKKVG